MTWWAAGISAAGSVLGGVLGSNASKSAANTQAESAKYASDLQQAQYWQTVKDLAPYKQAGNLALSNLNLLTGNQQVQPYQPPQIRLPGGGQPGVAPMGVGQAPQTSNLGMVNQAGAGRASPFAPQQNPYLQPGFALPQGMDNASIAALYKGVQGAPNYAQLQAGASPTGPNLTGDESFYPGWVTPGGSAPATPLKAADLAKAGISGANAVKFAGFTPQQQQELVTAAQNDPARFAALFKGYGMPTTNINIARSNFASIPTKVPSFTVSPAVPAKVVTPPVNPYNPLPLGAPDPTGGNLQTGGQWNPNSVLMKPFSLADFYTSPSYQWNLDQGTQAVNKAAASRGTYYAPKTLQDISKFTQGVAGNEFNNAYNMYNNNQGNIWNRMYAMAGMGQNAAALQGGFGANMANQVGANAMGAGNAQASGTVGAANAWQNAIGGVGNAVAYGLTQQQRSLFEQPGNDNLVPIQGNYRA